MIGRPASLPERHGTDPKSMTLEDVKHYCASVGCHSCVFMQTPFGGCLFEDAGSPACWSLDGLRTID